MNAMLPESNHIDWEKLMSILEAPADQRPALVAALSAGEQSLFARLQELHGDPLLTRTLQLDTMQAWQRTMEKATAPAPVRRLDGWKKWMAAACLLLLAGAGWLLWSQLRGDTPATGYQSIAQALAGHAPSAKVQLITADGQSVEIDSMRQLKEKDGTTIQLQKGAVSYRGGSHAMQTHNDALLMNTLIVPRGYMYSLTLSDGSKVWLNADSKISFPVHFAATERKVSVEGEAYFEVAHNEKWPFTVHVRDADVKVLGTSFDVKAYGKKMYTTLVTGSVLFAPAAALPVQLTPGRQVIYNAAAATTETRKVETADWTAWKDDDLVMVKMSLAELAEALERRYDVQISFTDEKLKEIQYNAAIHLTGNIVDMLSNLEQTGNIHFAVKDKKILILPADGK